MGQWVRQELSDHGKLSPIPGSDIPALEQGTWKEHQTEDRRYKEVSPPSWGSVPSSAKLAAGSPTSKGCCKAYVAVDREQS